MKAEPFALFKAVAPMKTPVCLNLLLFASLSCWGQKNTAKPYMPNNPLLRMLEQDNGYRDAHFGLDTTAISNLVFEIAVEDAGKISRIYHREPDSKLLGLAYADEISYDFQGGKLKSISLEFTGNTNRKAALEKLTSMYGPGLKRPHSSLGDYWWSTEHVLLSLGDGLGPGKYTVTFLHKAGAHKSH